MGTSEGKESVVSCILSIRAWPPAETVNGMRWCNPRAHTGDTHTHARSLSPLSSLSLSRSLSLYLSLSLVPSRQQPARCEKWIRWARGDGATPPLSSFFPPARLAAASQGPPLIIQTREWCNAHHIGRISPCNPQPPPRPPYTHVHTRREWAREGLCKHNFNNPLMNCVHSLNTKINPM